MAVGGGFAHRRKQRSFAPGIYVSWPPPRKIRIKMAIAWLRLMTGRAASAQAKGLGSEDTNQTRHVLAYSGPV
uniref:Uncharacterized protein n=1 Tax=Oryza meridionalis TaxID=40149 RepID=A0A0E0D1M8_9ORYZ